MGRVTPLMALRLIEMVLRENDGADVRELLKDSTVIEHRQLRLLDGKVLLRILMDAERNEAVLDLLQERYAGEEDSRIVILPVAATLPRAELEPSATRGLPPERVSREELYESIKNAARCSRSYLVMVALSTIVAAVGLQHNSAAIIIGAMVIAPLLGPNVALALGTALADLSLIRRASLASLFGIAIAMAVSVIIGLLVHVDPAMFEVASRTEVRLGDTTLALAAGCAGALAFTNGMPASSLIGVMVALALLPPLVAAGLLMGNGRPALAMGAWTLFLVNLICTNLAGVATFLVQGIHPLSWRQRDQALRDTHVAIGLWTLVLAVLVGLILLLRKG